MGYCTNCGSEVTEVGDFCTTCGTAMSSASAGSAAQSRRSSRALPTVDPLFGLLPAALLWFACSSLDFVSSPLFGQKSTLTQAASELAGRGVAPAVQSLVASITMASNGLLLVSVVIGALAILTKVRNAGWIAPVVSGTCLLGAVLLYRGADAVAQLSALWAQTSAPNEMMVTGAAVPAMWLALGSAVLIAWLSRPAAIPK